MTETDGLSDGEENGWDTVIDEAEALGEEYRENAWETLVVHPGDVTPLTGELFGLSVLLPRSEYDAAAEFLSKADFDTTQVYRRASANMLVLIAVFEATDDRVALVVPSFVQGEEPELRAQATREGELPLQLRALSAEERLVFTIADPSLVFES